MSERPIFRSNRPDGRFMSTAGFIHAYMKAHPPKLAFAPEMSAAQFPAWQERVRDKLREVMCFPDVPAQPAPKHLWTEKRDGYELQKWEAYPEPLSVVPYLVLIPDGINATSPGPAVLCFPGSATSKELLAGEPELDGSDPGNAHPKRNRMAQWYAREGITAIAVDNPGIGETADSIRPGRHEICVHAIWAGRHYEGISVFQKLAILEWAKRQSYVDPDRIAVSGHSLGAKPALVLGVLDPSLAAVVWNDFTSDWRERAIAMNLARIAIWQYVPGMLEWFDYTDLMAALAPRPFLITEGGRTKDIERVRDAYKLLGAERQMKVVYYPKYATPDLRPFDDEELPEGLSDEGYFLYANVDAPMHCFKENIAVPWLSRVLRKRGSKRRISR